MTTEVTTTKNGEIETGSVEIAVEAVAVANTKQHISSSPKTFARK